MDALAAQETPTIAADDVEAVAGVSRAHAHQILTRLARKGWLLRVKRGLYTVVPLGSPSPQSSIVDTWPLAMKIFAPCYISGWSAAEHWDLTEQIFNAVAVATAKPQRSRERTIAGTKFVCRTIDENKIFGTKKIWSGSAPIRVADPHRLIIDILVTPDFGGGVRHTLDVVQNYWKSKHANPERLLEYAQRYGKGVVFKRLGFTAEQFGSVPDEWLLRCQEGMSAGVSLLDPHGHKQGPIVTRWRLRVNAPAEAT